MKNISFGPAFKSVGRAFRLPPPHWLKAEDSLFSFGGCNMIFVVYLAVKSDCLAFGGCLRLMFSGRRQSFLLYWKVLYDNFLSAELPAPAAPHHERMMID